MKRFAEWVAIPTLICFVALMLGAEHIKAFSGWLYTAMSLTMGIGYAAVLYQNHRDRDERIAARAITKYKTDHGLK